MTGHASFFPQQEFRANNTKTLHVALDIAVILSHITVSVRYLL